MVQAVVRCTHREDVSKTLLMKCARTRYLPLSYDRWQPPNRPCSSAIRSPVGDGSRSKLEGLILSGRIYGKQEGARIRCDETMDRSV